MNVVVDTNVLVSGLLGASSPPGAIVRLLVSGEVTPCLDARLLGEYDAVLRRPRFGFDVESVNDLMGYFRHQGLWVTASPLAASARLPDASDEPFLEVAIAARAEVLITGNARHFPSRACGEVPVLAPARFIERYRAR